MRSFGPLFTTNFFGVVNDNFLKTLAGFTVMSWIPDESLQSVFMGCTGAALVLPYILCSPLADRLTCLASKRTILRLAKWAELPIVAVAVLGFVLHSPWTVVAAILLMGLQSSLYSPAKYALVRDVGGTDRISTGMGGMEGVSFAGVLVGTVLASVASDLFPTFAQYLCLALFALAGLAAAHTIKADEEQNREYHSVNPVRYLRRVWRMAKRYPGLNVTIFTLSVFWGAAAMLQLGMMIFGKQVLGLDSTHTGLILALAAVGIVAGQIIAGIIDRRHSLIGFSPLFGWIAAALTSVLYFAPLGPVPFAVATGLLTFDLGFFKLPLDAEIQKRVKGPKLNTILAYFNQISFLFMLFASVVYGLISWCFGPRAFLLPIMIALTVIPFVFTMSYRSVLLFIGRWIFRRRYAVTIEDPDGLLEPGGAYSYLVLPNHPAMVDPMIVGVEFLHHPVRPLCDELFFRSGIIAPWTLRTLEAVIVPDLRKNRTSRGASVARGLGDIVTGTLAAGGNVIFYPSGHIYTENREDIGTRQLAYNCCRALPDNAIVVGVRTTGLWGSIWSRKGRFESPAFVPTFVKSVLLWLFVSPFIPKRKVVLHVENLTARTSEWSKLTRLEFNRRLEDWYNEEPRPLNAPSEARDQDGREDNRPEN